MALDAVEEFPGPDAPAAPIMMALEAAEWEPRDVIELVYAIMMLNPYHYGTVLATLFAYNVGAAGACRGAGRGYKVCAKFFDKQSDLTNKAIRHLVSKGDKAIEKYDDLLAEELEEEGAIKDAVTRGTAEAEEADVGLWGNLFG
jgi:hypothetical protein